METVRLLTCDNSQEAALIKGRLENEGVRCFTTNENFTTLMPNLNGMLGAGVQLMVFKYDYNRVYHLLELGNSKSDVIHCPNCNSSNVRFGLGHNKIGKIAAVILSVLAFVPFNNIKKNFSCSDCQSEFKI